MWIHNFFKKYLVNNNARAEIFIYSIKCLSLTFYILIEEVYSGDV